MRHHPRRPRPSAIPFPIGLVLTGLLFACGPARLARAAVGFGQIDTFQDGTTMNWTEGDPSPNPPTNAPTGGPGGAGDAYLLNTSSGRSGAGSKMVMFNEAQWAGDYVAAGVTRIDAFAANPGAAPLQLRLALRSPTGTTFSSTTGIALPARTPWRRVSFDLTSAGLTNVGGNESLAAVLSNVAVLRVLSGSKGPAWEGDDLAGTLAVDDLRALRLPGDANFDGRVNGADLRIARLHLGRRTAGDAAGWHVGDFDFDGRVDAQDVVLLRRNFGKSIPTLAGADTIVAPVPEPGAMGLLVCLVGSVLLRRPR
jgi:hypothetical protein